MEKFSEESICSLRERIRPYLKDKRYRHTLSVEKEAAILGGIYLPDRVPELRVSALLHDITKKLDLEEQLNICRDFDIIYTEFDLMAPKTFHAKTAAAIVSSEFPEYATDDVVAGVRWHTTGRDGMSLFESLIYLADYIEETRTFDDCVKLRKFFYKGLESGTDKDKLLTDTMVLSFDMTIKVLIKEGAVVDNDTVSARNYFLHKRVSGSEDNV